MEDTDGTQSGLLNLWTIDLQENERNWEVELWSGISRAMYTEQDKFDENWSVNYNINIHYYRIIQHCYNKENSNHVDKIQIYQLNLTNWIT